MKDIDKVKETMNQLVLQQLGDKFGYDSSLRDLQKIDDASEQYKLTQQENEPLENLIRNALNYDSNVYKEALGIGHQTFGEPNGVMKS